MRHYLKIQLPFFDQLLSGKTFEVRRNDRGYQKGDVLVLREWVPQESLPYRGARYTGREITVGVNYVFHQGFGCDLGDLWFSGWTELTATSGAGLPARTFTKAGSLRVHHRRRNELRH